MRRRTFDALMVFAGLGLTAILAIAGVLLNWGHSFVNNEVHNQLAAQKIYFPPANSPAVKGAQFAPMRQYGGQLLTTGPQAEVYADHFIAIHLSDVAGGKTYAQVSELALANPKNATYAEQAATLFKGTTLRGMLLNAYGFWKMGQIAFIAAIVAFAGAGLMLILSFLGLLHLRGVTETDEVLAKISHRAKVQTA